MTSEWQMLADIRERRKRLTLEKMLGERRTAEHSRDAAQRARAEWQQRVAAQSDHGQATRVTAADGALDVGHLRQAAAWGGVLEARTRAQRGVAQQAEAAAQQCERLLDASRDRLRAAAASVEKVAHLQRLEAARRARADDARIDSDVDGLTATRWSARRHG